MTQDQSTGLGLVITLVTVTALLKVTVASDGPRLRRLLIAAWPLATLVGFGVVLALLPMGPNPSAEGLLIHFVGLFGLMVGGTFPGLLGAFFTPQDRARGAGAGILTLSILQLSAGADDEFGGALLVSLVIAAIAGAFFFFRPAIGARNKKAARIAQEVSLSRSPAQSLASLDADVSSRSEHQPVSPAPKFTMPLGTGKLPPADARTAIRADSPKAISPEFLNHGLSAAAGAALMAVVVILAGGIAGEKVFAAMLLYPMKWLPIPMMIGAAGGASLSLILKRRKL